MPEAVTLSGLCGLIVVAGAAAACGASSSDASVIDAAVLAADAAAPPTVRRFGIFEQRFDWPSSGYANPWEQVVLTVTFTPPVGHEVTIGGFLAGPDLWKARYSPASAGAWSWRATISDGSKSRQWSGAFTVVEAGRPGFMRIAANRSRWVLDDGSSFVPIGFNDCIVTTPGDPDSIYKLWGFDGPDPACTAGKCERRVDIDTYLAAHSGAGFNTFRWADDICGFDLKTTLASSGNVYSLEAGDWGDKMVGKLRQYEFHLMFTFFGFATPRPPTDLAAARRYIKYVVDRYGAYVDMWEISNEFPNPPETVSNDWYNQVAATIRSVDPYGHPISTSWERPDLESIDVSGPHWYVSESEYESDTATADRVAAVRHEAGARSVPIVFGEHGNTGVNWTPTSALRMRIRTWTAFFVAATFLFWNESSTKGSCPQPPLECNNPAANIYLGPIERATIKVFTDFTHGFDADAERVDVTVSPAGKVRAYAVRAPTRFAAYLHAYTDHANPTTGVILTVAPAAAGTATWINPATGAMLAPPLAVPAGSQTLPVPAFTIDAALLIR